MSSPACTIKAVFAGFNTTRDVDRDSFDELYDVHEGARAALKKANQHLGGNIYQVTYYDDWMVPTKAFYDSSRINIATAFAFALIIMLCATANWIVTLPVWVISDHRINYFSFDGLLRLGTERDRIY